MTQDLGMLFVVYCPFCACEASVMRWPETRALINIRGDFIVM